MTSQTVEAAPSAPENAPVPAWTTAQKIGFRLLFTLGGGLTLLAVFGSLQLGMIMPAVQDPFARLGALVTGTEPQLLALRGAGDSLGIWQYHIGWAVAAVVLTTVWTLLDRGRRDYRGLGGLLWQVGRIALASGMIFYGLGKAIPTQMAYMQLPTHALQPAGDISRMNMLWGFMGASDGYSIATGLVELISGLLLLSRRTWVLGALGSIISMVQVVLMDTFYNVPVKFLCFEFLLIAIALLAPQWINLVRVGFGRAAGPMPAIWRATGADRTRLRRTGKVLAVLAIASISALGVFSGVSAKAALAETRSDIDGVWHATSFRVDGTEATLARDPAWINLAITYRGRGMWESAGDGYTAFVTQDPSARATPWVLEVDGSALRIKARRSGPETVLRYTQPDRDHLTLAGRVDGREITAVYERRPMQRASEELRFTHPVPDEDAPSLDFP
ncbi:hypothetical protein [Tsukamurella sp. NPDC003166]|uniref:hypothetical protein n=1 Tax=Tsukamurella sp. NPDC003166 TaxID=3154444 RepID=UPI0033A0BFE5